MRTVGSKNRKFLGWFWVGVFAITAGCGGGEEATPDGGGGTQDTGGPVDTGGTPDIGGKPDTGGTPDAGVPDTGVPDTGVPDTGVEDGGADAGTAPDPREAELTLSEAGAATVSGQVTGAIIEVMEAEDQEALITLPPPGPGNCPAIDNSSKLDGKIVLDYGDGCRTKRGTWASGKIEIIRQDNGKIGPQKETWLYVDFKNHKRGFLPGRVEMNGVLLAMPTTRRGEFLVVNEFQDLGVGQPVETPMNIKIGAREYLLHMRAEDAADVFQASVSLADIVLRGGFEMDGKTLAPTKDVAISQDDPLTFKRDSDDCTCPVSGTITFTWTGEKSGKSIDFEVRLGYSMQSCPGLGKSDETEVKVRYCENGECRDLNTKDDKIPVTDLHSIKALCLGDGARTYSCPQPDSAGACEAIAGTYHLRGKDVDFFPKDQADRDAVFAKDYLYGMHPWRITDNCSMVTEAFAESLEKYRAKLVVAPNCAATFVDQRAGTVGTRAICGLVNLLDSGTAWDFYQPDLGIGTENGAGGLDKLLGDGKQAVSVVKGEVSNGTPSIHVERNPIASGAGGCSRTLPDKMSLQQCLSGANIALAKSDIVKMNTVATFFADTVEGALARCTDGTQQKSVLDQIMKYFDDTTDQNGKLKRQVIGANLGKLPALVSVLVGRDENDRYLNDATGIVKDGTQVISLPFVREEAGTCTGGGCVEDASEELVTWAREKIGGVVTGVKASLDEGRTYIFVAGRIKVYVPTLDSLRDFCQCAVNQIAAYQADFGACDANAAWFGQTTMTQDVGHFLYGDGTLPGLNDLCTWLDQAATDPVNVGPWCFEKDGNGECKKDGVATDLKEIVVKQIQAMQQKYNYDETDQSLTFDFSRVWVVDPGQTPPQDLAFAVASGTGKNYALQKGLQSENIVKALVEKGIIEPSEGSPITPHSWAWNSSQQQNAFAFEPKGSFTWSTAGSGDYPAIAANNVRLGAPAEIGMTLPPPFMLDNQYAPVTKWDGVYDKFVESLGEMPACGNARAAVPAFWSATKQGVADYLANVSSPTDLPEHVLFYLRTAEIVDQGQFNGLFPFEDRQTLYDKLFWIAPIPDIGIWTISWPAWWAFAPFGRNYMHSPQEIVDYTVHTVLKRGYHRKFSADEMYAGAEFNTETRGQDVGIAITLDLEYKPSIVINSDLFPGGNTTHFWHRNIAWALTPATCMK